MRALVAVAALALLARALPATESEPAEAAGGDPEEEDLDEDSDSAPFVVVVEHPLPTQWRCAGSLVSLRTCVTSAACARGRGAAASRSLWVLAGATAAGQAPRGAGARRVLRVATAGAAGAGADGDAAAVGAAPWGGVVLDMAVLELEAPFGSAARTRPILMATVTNECSREGSVCHVVRLLGPHPRARLRILDAALAQEAACAALARFWAAVRDQALCFTGPQLCSSEWGAGVVCEGKLCGVVSRSASAPGVTTAAVEPRAGLFARNAPECGDTHAAQSVARWRRFLHCAHTLRACGSGDCSELCSERRLMDEDGAAQASGASGGDAAPGRPTSEFVPILKQLESDKETGRYTAATQTVSGAGAAWPTRTSPPTRSEPPPVTKDAGPQALPASPRPAALFEPNRPDFRAGEYGDNAAEYGAPGDDAPMPTRSSPQPPPSVRTRPPPPPAPPHRSSAVTPEPEPPRVPESQPQRLPPPLPLETRPPETATTEAYSLANTHLPRRVLPIALFILFYF